MPERRDPFFESPDERDARERPQSIDLCGFEVRRFYRPEGEGSQFSPDRFRHFCFDDSSQEILKILIRDERISRKFGRAKSPLIEGPTDIGKTSAVEYYAHVTGRRLRRINCTKQTDVSDLIGKWVPEQSDFAHALTERLTAYNRHFGDDTTPQEKSALGLKATTKRLLDAAASAHRPLTKEESLAIAHAEGIDVPPSTGWVWQDGDVVKAMKHGDILLFDEINAMPVGVRLRLQSLFEDTPSLTLQENGGRAIQATDGFFAVATQNPPSHEGREPTPEDMLRRHNYQIVGELSRKTLDYRLERALDGQSRLANIFKPVLLDLHLGVKAMRREGQLGADQRQRVSVEFAWLRSTGEYLGTFEDGTEAKAVAIELLKNAVAYCYANRFQAEADRKEIMAALDRVLKSRNLEIVNAFRPEEHRETETEQQARLRATEALRKAAKNGGFLADVTYSPELPGLPSPDAPSPESRDAFVGGLYKDLEKSLNLRLAESGTSEHIDLSRETSRLPEYWTLRHTEVINEVLGFTEDKLAETMVPSFESLLSLGDTYLDAFYPTTKAEEPYLAFRPSWFDNPATDLKTTSGTEAFSSQTFWQVYRQAQRQTLHNFQGGLILIDPSRKPNHNPSDIRAQQYTTATGGPDPLLPLLQEAGYTRRFALNQEKVERFCAFLKNKIIDRLKAEGLRYNSEDITVALPPFTLMNILMTTDPRFQPSSTTDALERCADLITAGPAGTLEEPRALFCGDSVSGGAAYCGDGHAGYALDFWGFRPAVIVRTP